MTYYQALILLCLFKDLTTRQNDFTLTGVLNADFLSCKDSSTLLGYGILVTHGMPSHDEGAVMLKSMPINTSKTLQSNPLCNWTYEVNKFFHTVQRKLESGSNIQWNFSKPGLQKVLVTAKFNYGNKSEKIKNCTFVNVADCHIKLKVTVLVASQSYNITQNHTDVTMDSPGLINFTLTVIKIDRYFICRNLYFNWTFGDGCSAVGDHVNHYYNKSGVYSVVLNIFKVYDDRVREFFRNISLKVHVKEKYVPTEGISTVVDISLVLVIFFTCFVFVVCIAIYWYRRRLHRHTEVARFDFRPSELQSSFNEQHCSLNPSARNRVKCTNPMICRRGSDENLLNFAHYNDYSSFDSNYHELQ